MNQIHLQQIFANYIEKFEFLNNHVNRETYKWEIAARFRVMMDDALSLPDKQLPEALYELKRCSENLIDSYTQPFAGLSKFAEHEPATVRQMFRDLFADDGGDLAARHRKMLAFLRKSRALRDTYYPDSFLYQDDYHSVSAYLFLYDPDNHYLYKASHALKFADCVEFYDEWGAGEDIRLDVYYRMCDELVAEIKAFAPLLDTDKSRFRDRDDLFPDQNKRILVFDLIYCCSAYDLFKGITFERPNSKQKQLYLERRKKAIELAAALEKAKADAAVLEDAKATLGRIFAPACRLRHWQYGAGTVVENDGEHLLVRFDSISELKTFSLAQAVGNGFVTPATADDPSDIQKYAGFLRRETAIQNAVKYAEKALIPYHEYLPVPT